MPWEKSKCFDGSAVIGEKWIPKKELKDVNTIDFSLSQNGNIVQQSNTQYMLWKIDELIAYISQFFTLKIGDVIFTGTPEGVGKVAINDNLVGKIGDTQIFDINVK